MSYSTQYEYGDDGNVYDDGEAGRFGTFSGNSQKGNEVEVDIDASDQPVSGRWSNTPYSGTLEGGIIENCSADVAQRQPLCICDKRDNRPTR